MAAKKEIAPELMAEARRLYEETLAPVADIRGMLGLSRTNFYKRVHEGGWRGRRAKVGTFQFARALSGDAVAAMIPEPAEQPRAEAVTSAEPVTPQQRLAIAQRIMTVIELEMDAIQRILKNIVPADQLEAEAGARSVVSTTRALREIAALIKPDNETPQDDVDDDSIPLDIDQFRNELARRINSFIDAKRSGEGGTGGDVARITYAETT